MTSDEFVKKHEFCKKNLCKLKQIIESSDLGDDRAGFLTWLQEVLDNYMLNVCNSCRSNKEGFDE